MKRMGSDARVRTVSIEFPGKSSDGSGPIRSATFVSPLGQKFDKRLWRIYGIM